MSDDANQSKKPIWALTGLAIVAAAVIAFLTRGQWSPDKPQAVATEQQAPAASTPQTKAAEQPAAPATTTTTAAAEAPAANSTAGSGQQQTAAAEQPAVATAEQPAAQQIAPAAQTVTEQQATAPAAAQPAAGQPAAQASAEAPAKTEAPAAKTMEAPAKTDAPAATAAEAPAKTGAVIPAFDTVRVEKTGEAVIAGTAAAGSEVVIKFDGTEIGKTVANDDGAFVVVPDNPLPRGSGEITIEARGKGDLNPVASTQTVAVIVPAAEAKQDALVAVVSPDQPTKVLQKPAPAAGTGTAAAQPAEQSASASTTVAKTPAAEAKPVSIDAVDYDGAGNIVFSGDGTPGQTARIYVDNNFLADAPIGADGHWSFSGTADVKTGVHQLRVDAIDGSGKVANRVEVPFFREDQTKVAAAQTPEQTGAKTTDAGAEQGTSSAASQSTDQTAAATATGEAAQPQAPKEGRVVIQPGNNLWRISRVLYGNGQKYTMLYQANKDQIRNPNRIYPGQVFKTPDVTPKMESIDPKRRDPLTPEENAATQN